MAGTTAPPSKSLTRGFAEFVTGRFPFALDVALQAVDACVPTASGSAGDERAIEELRPRLRDDLRSRLLARGPREPGETTPGVAASRRFEGAVEELVEACDGFLRRWAIRSSLTPDERREILRGMVLTRATDNRLKLFFTSGEVTYGDAAFQGKGFRSLGQEAIYAAGIRRAGASSTSPATDGRETSWRR
jgi:hypothetical protein